MTTSDLGRIGDAARIYKKFCKENKKPFYKPSFTNSAILNSGIVLLRDDSGFVAAVHDNKVMGQS